MNQLDTSKIFTHLFANNPKSYYDIRNRQSAVGLITIGSRKRRKVWTDVIQTRPPSAKGNLVWKVKIDGVNVASVGEADVFSNRENFNGGNISDEQAVAIALSIEIARYFEQIAKQFRQSPCVVSLSLGYNEDIADASRPT